MFITFKKNIYFTNQHKYYEWKMIQTWGWLWLQWELESESVLVNFLMSMVESQSQLFGIELELCWVEFWIVMVYDSDSTHLCSSNSGAN